MQWTELKFLTWAEYQYLNIQEIEFLHNVKLVSWPCPKDTGVIKYHVYFYFKKED